MQFDRSIESPQVLDFWRNDDIVALRMEKLQVLTVSRQDQFDYRSVKKDF